MFIEFRKVMKEYQIGEVLIRVLDDVEFFILEGEFVVILGVSGVGKSMILNIFGGMDMVIFG